MRYLLAIGCGRSGSTFLTKLLREQRRCAFFGENDFLVPRLWNEVWTNRFWLNWQLYVEGRPTSSRDGLNPGQAVDLRKSINLHADPERIDAARRTAGTAVRDLMQQLYESPASYSVWGYKEIWNGTAWATYEWDSYDEVFPGGHWVHLVRHPLSFVKSVASWNKDLLTQDYLRARLVDWIGVVRHSRKRVSTGRYFEIRFEDLVADPNAALTPLLTALGLEWTSEMSRVREGGSILSSEFSTASDLDEESVANTVQAIDGLEEACSSLGYDLLSNSSGLFSS